MNLLNATTWPSDLKKCLKRHAPLLLSKELRDQRHVKETLDSYRKTTEEQWACRIRQSAETFNYAAYEDALAEIVGIMGRHTILGYHSTRLTEAEIQKILSEGMRLSSWELLAERIRFIESRGLIGADIADKLIGKNYAKDGNRKGMIWFCFHPPHLAGETGIELFLRRWGGESLYFPWMENPSMGPLLQKIGSPCLVEAEVPAAGLNPHSYLGARVARQFLLHEGHEIHEPALHEDYSVRPIAGSNIRRVIRHSDPDFIPLTRCDTWETALK